MRTRSEGLRIDGRPSGRRARLGVALALSATAGPPRRGSVRGRLAHWGLLALLVAAAPGAATAQRLVSDGVAPHLAGDVIVYGQAALPLGSFGDVIEPGGGAGFAATLAFEDASRIALRLEGGAIAFGRRPSALRSPGLVLGSELRSRTGAAWIGVGPQLFLATGAFRPYIFGTMGASYYESRTGGGDDDWFDDDWYDDDDRGRRGGDRWFDDDWYDDDWHGPRLEFDDFGLSAGGGLGLAMDLYRGEWPISLDMSAAYRYSGAVRLVGDELFASYMDAMARYRDDLRARLRMRSPLGSYDEHFRNLGNPVTANANLISIQLGVSVGVF